MGENMFNTSNLFVSTDGISFTRLRETKSIEIPTLAKGSLIEETSLLSTIGDNPVYCGIIKIKTISRKRFIKLLMARGVQRNEAHKIAKRLREMYNRAFTELDVSMYDFLLSPCIGRTLEFMLEIGEK